MEGDERAVVDVAPGEMAAAGEVVELVAEVAPADVGLPEIADDLDRELEEGEGEREAEGGVEVAGGSRRVAGGAWVMDMGSLDLSFLNFGMRAVRLRCGEGSVETSDGTGRDGCDEGVMPYFWDKDGA